MIQVPIPVPGVSAVCSLYSTEYRYHYRYYLYRKTDRPSCAPAHKFLNVLFHYFTARPKTPTRRTAGVPINFHCRKHNIRYTHSYSRLPVTGSGTWYTMMIIHQRTAISRRGAPTASLTKCKFLRGCNLMIEAEFKMDFLSGIRVLILYLSPFTP